MIESEERVVIKAEIPDHVQVERIEQDNLYSEGLFWINKLLVNLNEDERSAVYKHQYLCLFDMLMAATVNDGKKSGKTVDLLGKGFDLVSSSSFDEHFNRYGLLEFDHGNATGLNDLMRQFQETEEVYKHQFFAGSAAGGQYLCLVDVTRNQSQEAQKAIQEKLSKSVAAEAKTIACHHYLAYKLKKIYRSKSEQFHLAAKIKQFTYEDRLFASDLRLEQLLVVDQLPGIQVLNLLKQFYKKQMMLRQMIVSKYATNSLDIHYLLAKALDLDRIRSRFMAFMFTFIKEKGRILAEFVDLEKAEDNEFEV